MQGAIEINECYGYSKDDYHIAIPLKVKICTFEPVAIMRII